MSKSICVHCTEPELETREKRRDLFGFVGRDVENAQHIEMDTSGGIKEGTINDLNAAKVSAMKAAEIAGLDSSSVRWHISSRGRTGRDVLLWLPVDHKQGFHCIFALMKTDGRTA